MKEPFFFGPDDQAIYAMLHKPAAESDRAVIICPPFADEIQRSYRLLHNFAEQLAESGFLALRFDFRGCGDSRMAHVETDISTRLEDIAHSVKLVREKYGARHIYLLGLRFGASLAALAATDLHAVRGLILWDPILKGEEYLYESLRSHIATQSFVWREVRLNRDQLVANLRSGTPLNIDGYDVNEKCFDEACRLDLEAIAPRLKVPTLFVSILPERKTLTAARAVQIERIVGAISGASHQRVHELPFWVNKTEYLPESAPLQSITLDWLRQRA